jgi:hypothetical protein
MGFRYSVFVVQGVEPKTSVVEKLDTLGEARLRCKQWAARQDTLSARVWDHIESMWVYDAFEEFDG